MTEYLLNAGRSLVEAMLGVVLDVVRLIETEPEPTADEIRLRGYVAEWVEAALGGDQHRAKALMEIIAYLHEHALPLPLELRYYVGEAFKRVLIDGTAADEALGLKAGRGKHKKAHPFAQTNRYAYVLAQVRKWIATGHKDYIAWEIVAAEGLPALDGSDRLIPCHKDTVRKEYEAAAAFFDRVATSGK